MTVQGRSGTYAGISAGNSARLAEPSPARARYAPGSRSPPSGLWREPPRIPLDAADRGHYERPWCRSRPSPDRRLAVPCLGTMMRPCVGRPRFRGVFRLPHTPHVLPLTIAIQGLEIHAKNPNQPRMAYAARSGVFPRKRAAGFLLHPRRPYLLGPPSLPVIIVSWILRECPADPRNVYHLTGHSSYAGDSTITSN